MLRFLIVAFLSIGASSALAQGIQPLQRELSPLGRTYAHCIAYMKALRDTLAAKHPDLKKFDLAAKDSDPDYKRLYADAWRVEQRFKTAFGPQMASLGVAEAKRVYPTMIKDIGSDPLPLSEASAQSWRTCAAEYARITR